MAEYHFFTDRTRETFRSAAACIIPSEPDSPGADSESAIELADRMLAERPERDRRLLRLFLVLLELVPILRYGRRFSRLPFDRRRAVLRFFESTRIAAKLRQGFFGLKTFALLGYYGVPDTWRELDYPGPRLDAPYYTLRRKEG